MALIQTVNTDMEDSDIPELDLGTILRSIARSGTKVTDAHLRVVEKDIQVDNTKTTVHCYSLTLDGNGRVRYKPLAEFLRDRIVDYAIPRRKFEDAQREQIETKSAAPMARLHEEAKRLFASLENTGEGGELLLFAMAEAAFGYAQILCKMSLKTSTSMHYHGSDGVFLEAKSDGGLNLYWGEAKLYADAKSAIRACLNSLAPFLKDSEGADSSRKQDIFLINEFANFTDEKTVKALRAFFDQDNPKSSKVKHCGIALVVFDCDAYPKASEEGLIEVIEEALKELLPDWRDHIGSRVSAEHIETFDIHFICLPMQSAEEFRSYFLKLLGKVS